MVWILSIWGIYSLYVIGLVSGHHFGGGGRTFRWDAKGGIYIIGSVSLKGIMGSQPLFCSLLLPCYEMSDSAPHVLAMMCSLSTGPSNGGSFSWAGISKTVGQNKHFLFIGYDHRYLGIMMKSWYRASAMSLRWERKKSFPLFLIIYAFNIEDSYGWRNYFADDFIPVWRMFLQSTWNIKHLVQEMNT